MHLCIFEDEAVPHLRPLVDTRAVYDLRVGVRTLLQTIRATFGDPPTILHSRTFVGEGTAQENDLLVNRLPEALDVLFVNGRIVEMPQEIVEAIRRSARSGEPGRLWKQGEEVIAAWVPDTAPPLIQEDCLPCDAFGGMPEEAVEGVHLIGRLWHLLDHIEGGIARDFEARTKGYQVFEHSGATVQGGALLVHPERIYLAPGSTIRPGAILNAEHGPIYIGEGATVHEGAILRGPVALGPKAQALVGAMLEHAVIGPVCKVGGEVHGSVMHSYSSKAHAGYLGDSYLGRWCNLGADTNNSNLKNDYGPVSLYDVAEGDFVDSGRQFLGLFMGDHSKCSINFMFNTGTVVGVFCNLYGTGFPPRYIPNFSWGTPEELTDYRIDKALRVAEAVMARRDITLTDADRALLTALAEERVNG